MNKEAIVVTEPKELEVPCFNKKEVEEIVKDVFNEIAESTGKIESPKGSLLISAEEFDVDPSITLRIPIANSQTEELINSKNLTVVIDVDTEDAMFPYRRLMFKVVTSLKDADGDYGGNIIISMDGIEPTGFINIRHNVDELDLSLTAISAPVQSQLVQLFTAYRPVMSATIYYN